MLFKPRHPVVVGSCSQHSQALSELLSLSCEPDTFECSDCPSSLLLLLLVYLQAALISVQSALAVSPDDPQLLHDAAYITAEADLWGSVGRYDDPHIYKALEQYASKLEVGGWGAQGGEGGGRREGEQLARVRGKRGAG